MQRFQQQSVTTIPTRGGKYKIKFKIPAWAPQQVENPEADQSALIFSAEKKGIHKTLHFLKLSFPWFTSYITDYI